MVRISVPCTKYDTHNPGGKHIPKGGGLEFLWTTWGLFVSVCRNLPMTKTFGIRCSKMHDKVEVYNKMRKWQKICIEQIESPL